MSDNNKIENEQIGTETEESEAQSTANTDTVPTVEELAAKIAELEAAIKEKEDRYLRMAAEYDNFRRRSREEREAVYTDAVADTVSELLPIIDNLERAEKFEDGSKVLEGLKMIIGSAGSALSGLGVESYGAPGDKFDPNLHNAVMHEDDDSEREGEITDVFQKGYKKGKHIIRFAMVKTVN